MIENPMVLGDYYDFEIEPDAECPHCGIGWYRDDEGGWESDKPYHAKHAYGDPFHGCYCEECILDASTPERAQKFIREEVEREKEARWKIKEHTLPQVVLAWMGGNDRALLSDGYVDAETCKYLYNMILADEDGPEQIEETVKEIYEEEYSEFLMDVEDKGE